MKNVDVPMWDKGDSTDNYSGGGGSSSKFAFNSGEGNEKEIVEAFETTLLRKPTTRELAYYRISRLSKEEIEIRLLSSKEHKELLENAKKYPEVLKEKKLLESNIIKVRSILIDKDGEYIELKKLLDEKNSAIELLRNSKDQPYLTNKELLEESNSYNERKFSNMQRERKESHRESIWDKILELFFKNN